MYVGLVVLLLAVGGWTVYSRLSRNGAAESAQNGTTNTASDTNPLANKSFYVDKNRNITKLAERYRAQGNNANAKLIEKISSQPGTTWLLGPTDSDPQAKRDIAEVKRTSTEAAAQGTVPIYQLYAIPDRDACAEYSKNGFPSNAAYMTWLNQILAELKSEAVFSVEADGIAHSVVGNCMSRQQIDERYALLKSVMSRLQQSPRVIGAYLDAGHSEWFENPKVLVDPLRKSGIEMADGIAVNISFFAETDDITAWSKELLALIGEDKGVIIDTSRNGNGAPSAAITGEGRWCNPKGRAIGPLPTTDTGVDHVHAYFWGKIIGESDGACFGNPAAGTFMPAVALELAKTIKN